MLASVHIRCPEKALGDVIEYTENTSTFTSLCNTAHTTEKKLTEPENARKDYKVCEYLK